MLALLAAAFGLALVGFDPAGGLFGVAALVLGARARDVQIYGLLVIVLSAAYCAVAALALGTQVRRLDFRVLLTENWWRGGAELVAAAIALGWAGYRIWRRDRGADREKKDRRVGTFALVVAGVGYSLLSLLDPTFAALVLIAARADSIAGTILASVVWSVVTQLVLIALMVAITFGAHQPAARWLDRVWDRVRPTISMVLTVILVSAAVFLIADVSLWFWVPGPAA